MNGLEVRLMELALKTTKHFVYFLVTLTLLLLITSVFHHAIVSAMATTTFTQEGYRWRNDDGSQTAATWKAAANTAITGVSTGGSGEIIRLRFDLRETGGVSGTLNPRIEVGTGATCTGGTWTALNTSSTDWRLVTSSNFTDGDSTTQQISSGTFVAGRMSDSSNPTAGITLNNQVTEVEFAIRGTNASFSTTYYFRITNNGTAMSSYTNCAQLTTQAPPAPTKAVFTTAARTVTAGVCSTVVTVELQDDTDTPIVPTGSTVIRITSNSPSTLVVYSDSGCTATISGGDITYTTSDTQQSFYFIDTRKSNPTWSFSATKQSGPDTIATGNQNYTVNAGSVSRLVITLPSQTFTDGTGNSGSVTNRTAGSGFTITGISATDNYFNVNTSYSGAKTLAYSGPGNAPDTTAPSYTTSVSFTSGQSTTTLTTTLYRAESTTITTTDGGLYGYASSSVTVDNGTVQDYLVTAASSSFVAGACSSATIQARDSWENNASNDTSTVNATDSGTNVSFYTTGGCGTGTSSYTLSGGTSTAYFSSTLKQGNFTVTMTKQSDTPTGTSGNILVNPAAASALLIKLPGQSFVDGTGITGSSNFTGLRSPNSTAGVSYSIDIKAVDTYNNLVDSGPNNYTGSKTISWADSVAGNAPDTTAPSFPSTSIAFTNGEANSLSATYYNAATVRTIEADDTGTPVSGTASSTFTVQAAAAENFSLSASTPQTAGEAFSVSITARDDWENNLGALYSAPAGSYVWSSTATAAPDTTSPSIGTLVQGDFSAGTATKSITLYKNESVTFTASEPGPSTVTGTSTSITIDPGEISADASDSLVTGNSNGSPSVALTITITLKDTWRNPIAGVSSGNITISGTGSPSINQPISNTNASGETTGDLTWVSNGSYTVSVQISTVTLVQNDGTTPDADGYLDDTHSVTISDAPASTGIRGGATIRGGTTLQ